MEATTTGGPPMLPGAVQETTQGPAVETVSPGEAVHPHGTDDWVRLLHRHHTTGAIAAVPTGTAHIMEDIAHLFMTTDRTL